VYRRTAEPRRTIGPMPALRSTPARPLIGISPDVSEPAPGKPRVQCSLNYSRAVAAAGGLPVFLAPDLALIPHQLDSCAGFVLTGGDDPRMEEFGEPTHPAVTPLHALRQSYEVALIRALLDRPDIPVLGICLGMQIMSIVAGGKFNQHLPDTHPDAERHRHDRRHPVRPVGDSGLPPGEVLSHHSQAVTDPGRLLSAAVSDDGLIEAVQNPDAAFCLGVQWHPERMGQGPLGADLFSRLVRAASERSVEPARASSVPLRAAAG
jgi:gamma-glutamyl-gamma-aminobutyrate hydrolase PuuD